VSDSAELRIAGTVESVTIRQAGAKKVAEVLVLVVKPARGGRAEKPELIPCQLWNMDTATKLEKGDRIECPGELGSYAKEGRNGVWHNLQATIYNVVVVETAQRQAQPAEKPEANRTAQPPAAEPAPRPAAPEAKEEPDNDIPF